MAIYITLFSVLTLGILYYLFRISNLTGIVSPERERKRNKINATLFVVFLFILIGGFFWWAYTSSKYFLPEAVSVHGKELDQLFAVGHWMILVPFVVLHILLFAFVYKYRYNKNRRAAYTRDNRKLEILWTVIPFIALTIFSVYGLFVWNDIFYTDEKDPLRIEVMGRQFAWTIRYAGDDKNLGKSNYQLVDDINEVGLDFTDSASTDDFISRELHIPKGQQIVFHIRALDVLHSVYAPHFRLKMDAVPGMPTKFMFTATKTTSEMRAELQNPEFNYEIACAENCGRGHFAMRMIIIVEEQEDFEKWFQSQSSWSSQNKEYVAKKAGVIRKTSTK